ncbi:MAG TPA: Gfo/Idh/MocA family oxidoreductase [Usitatibacter sp.]|nr:Gfo/Idh/MocA family oxidoreductase [Usitatibacter sp.]
MSGRRLRLGVAGLGRGFTLMLPTLVRHPRVALAAAADPRAEARERFAADFGAATYGTVEALCADRSIEAVYVATPHERHAEHAILAARSGKHVLVEKPMAIAIAEAQAMVAAARAAGVHIVVGPSHSFDAPVARARELAASGAFGRVRMLCAMYHTDFLYRPRRPEELDTAKGGGVVPSQAAHQVDVLRLLAGSRATSVRAACGAWDAARPTEGAYGGLLAFEDGAFATLAYSGYAHFDGDELCDAIGETGREKDPGAYGSARRALAASPPGAGEAHAKNARNYGGASYAAHREDDAPWHEHFGFVLASCERADLRPTAKGVWIYGDAERRFEAIPKPAIPRAAVLDELCAAAFEGKRPLHDGSWGMATLEVCLAILRSSREGREIALSHQGPVG